MKLLKITHLQGNKMMHLHFSVNRPSISNSIPSVNSGKIAIAGGMILCQFKVEFMRMVNDNSTYFYIWSISELFEKIDGCDFIQYTIISKCFLDTNSEPIITDDEASKSSKISEDSITLVDTTLWHKKGSHNGLYDISYINFLIRIENIIIIPCQFNLLHDDTNLTDFELCAVDGSIDTHKAILAASSPMFNTMLSGDWKETTKGKVELAGVTKETLIDLKNYIYLRVLPTIPDNDKTFTRLAALLKLAAYLMMSDLIQACTAHLLLNLTTENAWQMIHLGGMYKLKGIIQGILSSLLNDSGNLINHRESPDDWM